MDWRLDSSDRIASPWCTALCGTGIVLQNLHSTLCIQHQRLYDTSSRDQSLLLIYPVAVQDLGIPLQATTFEVKKLFI